MGLTLNGGPGINRCIGIAYGYGELCICDLFARHVGLGDLNGGLFVHHLNAFSLSPIAVLEDVELAVCAELEAYGICGQVASGSLGLFKSVDRIHYEYAVGDLGCGVCGIELSNDDLIALYDSQLSTGDQHAAVGLLQLCGILLELIVSLEHNSIAVVCVPAVLRLGIECLLIGINGNVAVSVDHKGHALGDLCIALYGGLLCDCVGALCEGYALSSSCVG